VWAELQIGGARLPNDQGRHRRKTGLYHWAMLLGVKARRAGVERWATAPTSPVDGKF
jgi:hypothetical protein